MRLQLVEVVHWNFLIIVNKRQKPNFRHEHELLFDFNQVTFRTNCALNKCMICVFYEQLHKIVGSKYTFVLKK